MNVEEYAEQELRLGKRLLKRDGVWWKEIKRCFYRPLDFHTALALGASRPDRLKALVGYEHLVPGAERANGVYVSMEVDGSGPYDLSSFKKKRRYCIKRGLEELEIRRVEDLEEVLDQIYEVNVSAYARFDWPGNHEGMTNRDLLEKHARRTFGLPGRQDFFGAFYQGRLVAHLSSIQLEPVMMICSYLAHSDYLQYFPSEALIYTFTKQALEKPGIQRITFGPECARESLNQFKEHMGFKRVKYPLLRRLNPLLVPAIRLTRYRHYLDQS